MKDNVIEGTVWEPVKITVTNHLTGEISEIEAKGPDSAKDGYLQLSASETAIKKAKKSLLGYLEQWLGEDEEYKFNDGKIIKRTQRETRQWTIEALRSVGLDQDQIEVCTKVDMSVAKELLLELQERGEVPMNAVKKLNEAAEVKSTVPFVVIK
jgi:hypothetical protein